MVGATFDKSRTLPLYARIGEAGVPKILTFNNANGTPHDISSLNFQIPVKKRAGYRENLFILTIGDGLTVEGADNNKLRIEITAEQATQQNDSVFWTLYAEAEDHTWLNGFLRFHNGEFDGVEETDTITISENGEDIIISISTSGITQEELEEAIEESLEITVSTISSTATLTPTTFDAYEITAQAEALTIANPSTDYANFDGFIIRLEDNGTARALTFGNKYRAQGEALPTTTTLGKVMIITALRDSTADKYDVRFSEEV